MARVVEPVTHLPFVNADIIASQRWPDAPDEHGHDASLAAARERNRLMVDRTSFITETVFSHRSKIDLVADATALGYLVHFHVMLVPDTLPVRRVAQRVLHGGHDVPEAKIRERYARLWPLVAEARDLADRATFYDNSLARSPFRVVATYERGRLVGEAVWPNWTPSVLTA